MSNSKIEKINNLNILLLCRYDTQNASTVTDHIDAFSKYSKHNIFVLSNIGELPIELDLNRFDAIILHYSITIALHSYLPIVARKAIKDFEGLKIVFIQDEYRFQHKTLNALNELGINILFTCVPEQQIEKIYPTFEVPNLIKINVLTGYVAEDLICYPTIPLANRKYDVSYRGRVYPYWHGQLGLEKWIIAENFSNDAVKYELRTNISCNESKRLYGNQWIDLLRNSIAVLGVESGASYLDPYGDLSAFVECYTSLTMSRAQPSVEDYLEIYEMVLKNNANEINIRQISPRCFEAIALKTALILYEGNYSNVIKPWEHFIPLKKDHSNMDEVVKTLKSQKEMAHIIAKAYADVACSNKYSYQAFIQKIDTVIEDNYSSKYKTCANPYMLKDFQMKFSINSDLKNSLPNNMLTKLKSFVPRPIKVTVKKLRSIYIN